MTPDADNGQRLEASRQAAIERSDAFLAALPPELNALDDQIEAVLGRENASPKSKLGKVYRLADAAAAAAEPYVACRKGCSACCKMNVSISSLEAERLAVMSGRKVQTLQQPINHEEGRFAGVPCPFLSEDVCSVYDVRPYACRVHFSFDQDSYWCQPERAYVADMRMVQLGRAGAAYTAIALKTKLGGFADIRDFFPS